MRDVLALAADLHRRHRPFVLATVVWARSPSSGKAGGTALIEPDGTVHGWIGGACAEPAVLREARRILRDGSPRLMYMGPAEELDGARRDGVTVVPIACGSEGSLEVFMEPVLPRPHVVIAGRSPAVGTLTHLLAALDWMATVVGDEAPEALHESTVHVPLAEWDSIEIGEFTPIIVASQGHFDEPVLVKALESASAYIGLVASRSRAATVLGYLRDRGYSEDELGRIESPAGIDLGPIEHREIAVAMLARLVELRAAGAFEGASPSATQEAIDPICGMTVDLNRTSFVSEVGEERVGFCSAGCQEAFAATLR